MKNSLNIQCPNPCPPVRIKINFYFHFSVQFDKDIQYLQKTFMRYPKEQACNHKFFRVGKVSLNQSTSVNILSKSQKKGATGKSFQVFSPRYSQNWNLNGKFNLRIQTRSGPFFQNQDTFLIFKKGQGRCPPLPLVAHLKKHKDKNLC